MNQPLALMGTLVTASALTLWAHGHDMGPGMMRGDGMSADSANSGQPVQLAVNADAADALRAYVREHNLRCGQCHSISGGGFAPSFAAVSAGYADRRDAAATLTDRIAHGFRRMPGGLASNAESARLAELILNLTQPDSH